MISPQVFGRRICKNFGEQEHTQEKTKREAKSLNQLCWTNFEQFDAKTLRERVLYNSIRRTGLVSCSLCLRQFEIEKQNERKVGRENKYKAFVTLSNENMEVFQCMNKTTDVEYPRRNKSSLANQTSQYVQNKHNTKWKMFCTVLTYSLFCISNLNLSLRSPVRFLLPTHNSFVDTVRAHFPCSILCLFNLLVSAKHVGLHIPYSVPIVIRIYCPLFSFRFIYSPF